jgi:hypothetical protein
VFLFKNRKFPVLVGSGTKQLQADETLEATADCTEAAVEVPTQLVAHVAVPVGENTAVGAAVHELQNDSRLSRLAVNCLLKALTQLLPPQLGLFGQYIARFGNRRDSTYGEVEVGAAVVAAALSITGWGLGFAFPVSLFLNLSTSFGL